MKKLALIVLTLFLLSGCFGIKFQVVGDNELASIDKVAITTAVEVIKAKYPEKAQSIVRYCDIALKADDDMFEAYFNNGLQLLPDMIKDPVIRGVVKGVLMSYRIDVDTGLIDFDDGALRRARQFMTNVKKAFGG
jgi:hypothetical protein